MMRSFNTKYLLPWKDMDGKKIIFSRPTLGSNECAGFVYCKNKKWYRTGGLWCGIAFSTKEDAMISLDHSLIYENYEIISENKLLILL